jgi:ribose-phosphate pyrophosphokinase
MRQDAAFQPGEAVSQRIVGGFLADLFDAVVTVDPHLHRIDRLEQAVPVAQPIALGAAPLLAGLLASLAPDAVVVGPDEESMRWVAPIAERAGRPHTTFVKTRHGDRDVEVVAEIGAPRAGRIVGFDHLRIARAARHAGAPARPGAGLDLLVRRGDAVSAGQPLYRLHAETPGEFELARRWCEADPGIAIE